MEIGLFQIQQRTDGQIMACFRFPFNFTLSAESKVTVRSKEINWVMNSLNFKLNHKFYHQFYYRFGLQIVSINIDHPYMFYGPKKKDGRFHQIVWLYYVNPMVRYVPTITTNINATIYLYFHSRQLMINSIIHSCYLGFWRSLGCSMDLLCRSDQSISLSFKKETGIA